MDLFVSNYTLRLDAKGRVSIPAPYRAVLARGGFEGLYCYPTLDGAAPVAGAQAIGILHLRPGGVYGDGTFGGGGHTRALLATPGAQVIGIDRDRDAVAAGFDLVDTSEGRLTLVEDRFSRLDEIARDLG